MEEVLGDERHAGALRAAEALVGRGQQLALLDALGRRVGDPQAPRDGGERHAALGEQELRVAGVACRPAGPAPHEAPAHVSGAARGVGDVGVVVVRPREARAGDEAAGVERVEQAVGEAVIAGHVGRRGAGEDHRAAEVGGDALGGDEHRRHRLGRRALEVGLVAQLEHVQARAVARDGPAHEALPRRRGGHAAADPGRRAVEREDRAQPVGTRHGELVVERGDAVGVEGPRGRHERRPVGPQAHPARATVGQQGPVARDPQVLRAAGRDAARRPQRHAAPRDGGQRGRGRERRDAREQSRAADAHGDRAGARQQLAAGQLSGSLRHSAGRCRCSGRRRRGTRRA